MTNPVTVSEAVPTKKVDNSSHDCSNPENRASNPPSIDSEAEKIARIHGARGKYFVRPLGL